MGGWEWEWGEDVALLKLFLFESLALLICQALLFVISLYADAVQEHLQLQADRRPHCSKSLSRLKLTALHLISIWTQKACITITEKCYADILSAATSRTLTHLWSGINWQTEREHGTWTRPPSSFHPSSLWVRLICPRSITSSRKEQCRTQPLD